MTSILTHFVGATNTRGSRIIADAGMKRRVSIPYPHELSIDQAHRAAAMALCQKFDWHGTLVQGGMERGSAFVFLSASDMFTV